MEYQKTKSMTKQNEDNKESEDLNKLLSMRGKPFSDWKEERKYLREKWGMQGRQIDPNSTNQKESNQRKKIHELGSSWRF